jgi:hypothetical protein
LAFVNVFSDLGLGAVLIVHQDLDQIQMGTVLSLMLITGAVAVLSLALLINVFAWFYQMLMQRELEFRRLFGCHVVQTIGYVIVTLSLAIAGAGAWSLVAGELTSGLMLSAALLIATPYRVVPALARARVRELFGAGWGFLARPVIHRGERRPPDHRAPAWHRPARLLLDRLPARGDALLGLAHPVTMVTFPEFSRTRERGEEITSAFLASLRFVAVLTVPVGVLLSATAGSVVHALLGEQWTPAIGVIAIMGLWAAVRSLAGVLAWLLNSVGEAKLLAKVSGTVVLALIACVAVAASLGDVRDVACVVLADAVLNVVVYGVCIQRRAGIALGDLWRAVRAPLLAAPGAWLAAAEVNRAAEDSPAGVTLAGALLCGLTAYALARPVDHHVDPGSGPAGDSGRSRLTWGASATATMRWRRPRARAISAAVCPAIAAGAARRTSRSRRITATAERSTPGVRRSPTSNPYVARRSASSGCEETIPKTRLKELSRMSSARRARSSPAVRGAGAWSMTSSGSNTTRQPWLRVHAHIGISEWTCDPRPRR